VRLDQSASIDTHNGVIPGHVGALSLNSVSGMRGVMIGPISALPAGVGVNSKVDATIAVGKLENVLYVGRPVNSNPNSELSLFKVVDDGKGAERVNVKFGLVSVSTIQVLSGLNVGDTVILSDMTPYANFDRIQIKH